jgi:integrase
MSTDAPARRTARPARGPRALTVEEAHLLQGRLAADAAAARQDLPDLVAFLLGTGLRIGETWSPRGSAADGVAAPGDGAGRCSSWWRWAEQRSAGLAG